MTLRLILSEIAHRRGNFLLAAAMAALAVASLAFTNRMLRDHDARAIAAEAELQASTEAEVKGLEDRIRKDMKGLGFNIHIYPENQQLHNVYAQGFGSETMPETYVSRLATSKVATINHLLPRLIRKLEWPELERTVILIGIRGEVPLAHRDPKKPLIDPVAAGAVVLGHELHRAADVKPGDTVTFKGRTLEVAACHPPRGSADDITLWMNLAETQTMLGLEGRINEILALECNCASLDRLGEIRREVQTILPNTQVIEKESQALARAEARNAVAESGRERLAQLSAAHEAQRAERTRTASLILPLIALFCAGGIAYLSLANLRERRSEIAILRAMGLGSVRVLGIVLARAALAGLIGGSVGLLLARGGGFPAWQWPALATAAALTALIAAWLPAVLAARQDPAAILHE